MGISFNPEWSLSEFYSRTVRGKNENFYASVRVVIAVKVIPSEKKLKPDLSVCADCAGDIIKLSQ